MNKDVDVTDVITLDNFASRLDIFSETYTSNLSRLYDAADSDIRHANGIIDKMEEKLKQAELQKERAESALDNYLKSCRWEERTPDDNIVSNLKQQIEEADRRIQFIKGKLYEAETLCGDVKSLAHQADSYMSYGVEIRELCDETTRATRNAADSIRAYR